MNRFSGGLRDLIRIHGLHGQLSKRSERELLFGFYHAVANFPIAGGAYLMEAIAPGFGLPSLLVLVPFFHSIAGMAATTRWHSIRSDLEDPVPPVNLDRLAHDRLRLICEEIDSLRLPSDASARLKESAYQEWLREAQTARKRLAEGPTSGGNKAPVG